MQAFEQVIAHHRGGDPMNAEIQFTYLSRREVRAKLCQLGIILSLYFIDKFLSQLGLTQRKLSKSGTYKQVQGRNEQFEYLAQLVDQYQQAGHIVISMDAKKKEQLGQFYRAGKVYCSGSVVCNDHDFASQASGKVAPFGIYDGQLNEGYLFLGQSADTPDFVADCLYEYIKSYVPRRYPQARQMLILCDSGGSNGYRNHRFKEMVQWVANCTGLTIRVAHYPSYCSKYNPCDHRLFPHVTRAWSGVILDSVELMRDLVKARAKTATGLNVFVRQIKTEYHTGIKATPEFLNDYPIIHDTLLPQWNYWAIPNH